MLDRERAVGARGPLRARDDPPAGTDGVGGDGTRGARVDGDPIPVPAPLGEAREQVRLEQDDWLARVQERTVGTRLHHGDGADLRGGDSEAGGDVEEGGEGGGLGL